MECPSVAYSDASNPSKESGDLFRDLTFWLSRTVPSRSWIKQIIEANGGKVVLLEKDADVLLVDHLKRGNPVGSTSFQYVEKSIQKGKLENLDDHRAGPPSDYIRSVGSVTRPKGHRSTFTAKDDQILYDWVKPFEQNGGQIAGNKIYQQLAEKHPQHTFQSWRDRYLKKVKDRPRPVTPDRERSTATVARGPAGRTTSEGGQQRDELDTRFPESDSKRYESFTSEDKEELLNHVKDVLNIEPGKEDEAWSLFAENTGKSVEEWKSFFDNVVLPEYNAKRSKDSKRRRSAADIPSAAVESGSPQNCKRRAAESIPQKTISPSPTNQQSNNPITSISRSPNSCQPPTQKASPQTNSNSPYSNNNEQSMPKSRSISVSEESFETAPKFQQDTMEVQCRTPPEVLNRRGEFNGSPTPRPTPAARAPTYPDNNTSSEDQAAIREMDEWISSKVTGSKAYSQLQVLDALACTTMDPDLAETVLEHMAAGRGIPSNIRGVWTKEDDEWLDAADPKCIQALIKKHGNELFNARFEYIMARREVVMRKGESAK
ncbi:hypothetical protein GX48_06931 [Paracoccidioides brasiliensis]|nr:hypothetical protein GX48_06931 [Paracoccidioides brasiliensis]